MHFTELPQSPSLRSGDSPLLKAGAKGGFAASLSLLKVGAKGGFAASPLKVGAKGGFAASPL